MIIDKAEDKINQGLNLKLIIRRSKLLYVSLCIFTIMFPYIIGVNFFFQSSVRLFSIGCGLQVCVKLLLQFSRMWKKPKLIFSNVFQLDTIRLGALFAGFGGLFRVSICVRFQFSLVLKI